MPSDISPEGVSEDDDAVLSDEDDAVLSDEDDVCSVTEEDDTADVPLPSDEELVFVSLPDEADAAAVSPLFAEDVFTEDVLTADDAALLPDVAALSPQPASSKAAAAIDTAIILILCNAFFFIF